MKGLMNWLPVAGVFVGLAFAITPTAEAARRARVRYVRPVHVHHYAAPVVVHAHPVRRVYVPARRVYVPHTYVAPRAVHVSPPGVHVYYGTRYGPRVVTPWVTVW
jgi:hypothetical protein